LGGLPLQHVRPRLSEWDDRLADPPQLATTEHEAVDLRSTVGHLLRVS
jgi:hypothetical protein